MRNPATAQVILRRPTIRRVAGWALLTFSVLAGATWGEQAEPDKPPQHEPPARVSADQLLQLRRQHLIAGSPEPDLVWLRVADQQIMAAWQPATSGSQKGAVLILPAAEQDPVTPIYLRNLHRFLPPHGWATLSLELPGPPTPSIPPRPAPQAGGERDQPQTEPAEPQEENAAEPIDETQVVFTDLAAPLADSSEAVAAEPQKRPALTPEELTAATLAHIQAGIDFLHAEGHYNIVLLGLGQGAAQGLIYLESTKGRGLPEGAPMNAGDRWIRAVALIQPSTTYWPQMPPIHELLGNPETPLLDLFIQDAGVASREAQLRRQRSRALNYENYIQRGLSAPPQDTGREDRVTKTVRGFITRHAEGVEER